MGVVHFKIICASVLMGPDWWLKTAFEQVLSLKNDINPNADLC